MKRLALHGTGVVVALALVMLGLAACNQTRTSDCESSYACDTAANTLMLKITCGDKITLSPLRACGADAVCEGRKANSLVFAATTDGDLETAETETPEDTTPVVDGDAEPATETEATEPPDSGILYYDCYPTTDADGDTEAPAETEGEK